MNSADPKILQFKICFATAKKNALPKNFPVCNELTESFGLHLQVKVVISGSMMKQVVDALNFSNPGSRKMLADSNIVWRTGMRRDN